jgi:O-succinylbenzoate synthase
MRIAEATLFHIAIPCTPFETSFGTIRVRPALILRLRSQTGLLGYGEASLLYEPLSEREVVEDGIRLLSERLPALIEKDFTEPADILPYLDRNAPVTTFAIEAAYTDLCAKEKNLPLARYFGAQRNTVLAGESIGLQGGIDGMLAEMQKYVFEGISRIKIKIKPGSDRGLIRAARGAYPDLELGADANAAYTSADLPLLESLREFDLAFIEQPFAADDLESHRVLNRSSPVCLDESVVDERTCKEAIEHRACSLINIKPARIGSFSASKRIHDMCVTAGVGLFGGGRLETGIGKTMNAAFYALPGFTHASDITPPGDYLAKDVALPAFKIANGMYTLPEGVGSGVTLDHEALKEFLVDTISFTS